MTTLLSSIESYYATTSNGAGCVVVRTTSGVTHREMGIGALKIDERIEAST